MSTLFENLQLMHESKFNRKIMKEVKLKESYNNAVEISNLNKNADILRYLMDMLDLTAKSKLSTKSNQLFVFNNLKRIIGISTVDEALELLADAIEEDDNSENGNNINKIKNALQDMKFTSGVLKILNMSGHPEYYMNIDNSLAFAFKYDTDGTILFSNDDGISWLDIDNLVHEARVNAEEDSDYDEFSYDTVDLADDMYKEFKKFKNSIA